MTEFEEIKRLHLNTLERMRQEKRYDLLLNIVSPDLVDELNQSLPILIDSARGMCQRTYTPTGVERVHERLMQIGGKSLYRVNGSVDLRRDTSRYLWALAPAVGGRKDEVRQASLAVLKKAKMEVPEDSWQWALMDIEEKNKLRKMGKRVDLEVVENDLRRVLKAEIIDSDRDRAATHWVMEIRGDVKVFPRVAQERVREVLLTASGQLPKTRREEIFVQVERMAKVWS